MLGKQPLRVAALAIAVPLLQLAIRHVCRKYFLAGTRHLTAAAIESSNTRKANANNAFASSSQEASTKHTTASAPAAVSLTPDISSPSTLTPPSAPDRSRSTTSQLAASEEDAIPVQQHQTVLPSPELSRQSSSDARAALVQAAVQQRVHEDQAQVRSSSSSSVTGNSRNNHRGWSSEAGPARPLGGSVDPDRASRLYGQLAGGSRTPSASSSREGSFRNRSRGGGGSGGRYGVLAASGRNLAASPQSQQIAASAPVSLADSPAISVAERSDDDDSFCRAASPRSRRRWASGTSRWATWDVESPSRGVNLAAGGWTAEERMLRQSTRAARRENARPSRPHDC